MNCFSEEQLSRISHLVREIEKLTDVEKLFLYLQLPCGRADTSDATSKAPRFNGGGIQKSFDLFAKKPDQETTQTYTWILSHLEIDPNVSLPKQEVYDEYRAFCQANRFEPLCVADFGKAMKHAFPCIKPRRLGQRGNSRYCYSGLRKKYKIQPPNLPDITGSNDEQVMYCTVTNCDRQTNITTSATSGATNYHTSASSTSSSNNNNNNFSNGNNMTIKSNDNFDRYNKRLSYNRPEVINLKIEPNNHQQSTNHNPNGAVNSNVIQFQEDQANKQLQQVCPFQHDDIGQSSNRINHHQQPLSQQQHHNHQQSAETSSAGSYDGGLGLGHHLSHHSRYTDYNSRTIQQPGTPDDDDYQHNYQDKPPLNCHFLNSSAAHGSQATQTISLTGATNNTGGNFGGYHHQQSFAPMSTTSITTTASTTTDTGHLEAPHNSIMQHNEGNKYISSVIQSQPPFNSTGIIPATNSSRGSHISSPIRPALQTTATTSCNIHLINHQMNVNHMDACASPFQSPASTPYPSMSTGNYPIQDMMQDAYCSSGCRLYQST